MNDINIQNETSVSVSENSPYLEIERFPMNSDTISEAFSYLSNRTTQLLSNESLSKKSYSVKKPQLLKIPDSDSVWGVSISFEFDSETETETLSKTNVSSIYVLNSHRGKGYYSKHCIENNVEIATTPDCDLEKYLTYKKIPFRVADVPQWPEYKLISKFYGNKITRRTKLYLINHIDEGLYILHSIGASELAKRAYCIHPLVQDDKDIVNFFNNKQGLDEQNTHPIHLVDPFVLILAIEYRKTANAHLSFHEPTTPQLSPLKDVNDMLIADKIQNCKDFERYHIHHHPRRERLGSYFQEWFKALSITTQQYQTIVDAIYCRSIGEKHL